MKPFTLEWWLDIESMAETQLRNCHDLMRRKMRQDDGEGSDEAYQQWQRYVVLWQWIRERIITKYGEQNETT